VRRAALLGLALALWLSAPAAAAPWDRHRVDDARATLKRVNALRASFGAPRLTEVPEWSTGCAKHVAYMVRNGIGHYEEPGAPGYTPDGATAGETSVLSLPPREPFPRRAPLGLWSDAPYHQSQVLDPRLRRTGFARGCMNTIAGLEEPPPPDLPPPPAPPRLLAWPGEGAKAVPRAVNACNELPGNPFRDVGWSCGGVGTALYVYALDATTGGCAWLEDVLPQVSVTSKGQALPVAVVPSTSCGWIAVTGRPLPRQASVRMDVALAGATLTHRFSTVVPKKPKRKKKRRRH
jgi:hypothetical protein